MQIIPNKNKYCRCQQAIMAVVRMRFTGSGNGIHYIDINKALSLQERKLHRQKVLNTIYGGYFVDSASESQNSRCNINVSPATWPVKRAVNRGFALWRKMISRTLKDMEGAGTPSYNDFKVLLNQDMYLNAPLLPKDAGGNNLYNAGAGPEWDYSTLTSEDPDGPGGGSPDQFELHIVGPHTGADPDWNRIGLVQSWVNSRAIPDSAHPDLPADFTTDPLNNLFDAGDVQDDRLAILSNENDGAPYDEETMFGNAAGVSIVNNLQRVSTSITTTTAPVAMVQGFEALCGLVQVDVTATGAWELVLDVESKGAKF